MFKRGKTQRYRCICLALTPSQAFIAHKDAVEADDRVGVWVPAMAVVYFEGKWCYADLTDAEAKGLGYAN